MMLINDDPKHERKDHDYAVMHDDDADDIPTMSAQESMSRATKVMMMMMIP